MDVLAGRIGKDADAVAIVREGAAAYVDLTGLDADAENVLAPWLRDGESEKVVHGYKAALKALTSRGLGLEGVVDDTSISGYLIEPDRRTYELAELAQHHLNIHVSAEAAKAGQLELEFDDDAAAASGALVQVAAVVHKLSRYFEAELKDRGAEELLATLELPVSRVLADMELAGIAIDMPRMDEQLSDTGQGDRQRPGARLRRDRPRGEPRIAEAAADRAVRRTPAAQDQEDQVRVHHRRRVAEKPAGKDRP